MGHDLTSLADKVEQLSGPDREVDRDIEIAIHNLTSRGHEDPRDDSTARRVLISHGAQPWNYEVAAFSGISLRTPLAYTASIDAAMTLAPEGWAVNLWQTTEGDRRQYTGNETLPDWVANLLRHENSGYGRDKELPHHFMHGYANTPALALTAVCLRALAKGN